MRLMFVSDEQCLVEHFFRVLRTSCDVCHLTDLVNFMFNLSATELICFPRILTRRLLILVYLLTRLYNNTSWVVD